MKIILRNGSGDVRILVPRGIKVTAYSAGLFFAGLSGKFDFSGFHSRGFEVVPVQSCSGPGILVSWEGGPVADSANNWWLVCE